MVKVLPTCICLLTTTSGKECDFNVPFSKHDIVITVKVSNRRIVLANEWSIINQIKDQVTSYLLPDCFIVLF